MPRPRGLPSPLLRLVRARVTIPLVPVVLDLTLRVPDALRHRVPDGLADQLTEPLDVVERPELDRDLSLGLKVARDELGHTVPVLPVLVKLPVGTEQSFSGLLRLVERGLAPVDHQLTMRPSRRRCGGRGGPCSSCTSRRPRRATPLRRA